MNGFTSLSATTAGAIALVASIGVLGEALGASSAQAAPHYGAYAHGMIHNSGCSSTGAMLDNNATCFFSGTSPMAWTSPSFRDATTSAAGAVGAGASGQAEAWADMSTGDLFAMASSTAAGPNGSSPLAAIGLAGMFETIQFHGAAHGATGTVRMNGIATYAGDVWGGASILVQTGAFDPMFDSFFFMPETIVDCTDCSGAVAYERTQTFNILNDTPYTFIAILMAFAANDGEPGTISITDPMSFELPEGVTFTSGSEQFLAGPSTHAVPEPSTLALMGLGLVGLAGARRRKG